MQQSAILTLVNTNGALSEAQPFGESDNVTVHIYGVNGHTIKLWGSCEADRPTAITNAVQIGDDITANALLAVDAGVVWLIVETDVAGTGTPTCVIVGRK